MDCSCRAAFFSQKETAADWWDRFEHGNGKSSPCKSHHAWNQNDLQPFKAFLQDSATHSKDKAAHTQLKASCGVLTDGRRVKTFCVEDAITNQHGLSYQQVTAILAHAVSFFGLLHYFLFSVLESMLDHSDIFSTYSLQPTTMQGPNNGFWECHPSW